MSSTYQPLLTFDPPKIIDFDISPNTYSNRVFTITNVSDQYVGFKIKTTTPAHYLVHPCIGVIDPSKAATIRIRLQPLSEDTLSQYSGSRSSDEKNIILNTNEKFQILSHGLGNEPPTVELNEMWKNLKPQEKGHRLNVRFILSSSFESYLQSQPYYKEYSSSQQESTFNKNSENYTNRELELAQYVEALEKRLGTFQLENEQLKLQVEKANKEKLDFFLKFLFSKPFYLIFSILIIGFFFSSLKNFAKQLF